MSNSFRSGRTFRISARLFAAMKGGIFGPRNSTPPPPVVNSTYIRLTALFSLVLLALTAALLWLPSNDSAQAQSGRTVPADWHLAPGGLESGDSFRLLFVTSISTDASSSDIADYNAHVRKAAGRNYNLQQFEDEFTALISTAAMDAKDNTGTTGAGVSIYWLNGDKVADDYADLYDGDWDSVAGKTEDRTDYTSLVWTGGNKAGTKSGRKYAGAARVRLGDLGDAETPLSSPQDLASVTPFPLYALSPVITLTEPEPENRVPALANLKQIHVPEQQLRQMRNIATLNTSNIVLLQVSRHGKYMMEIQHRRSGESDWTNSRFTTDWTITYFEGVSDAHSHVVAHSLPGEGSYDFRLRMRPIEVGELGNNVMGDASGPWSRITAATNRPPRFSSATTTRSIAENAPPGANVGEPVTATDPDGDSIAYSLSGADATPFSIAASTGQITANSPLEYHKRSAYSVTVSASDGRGGSDSIEVAISILEADPETDRKLAISDLKQIKVSESHSSLANIALEWTPPDKFDTDRHIYRIEYRRSGDAKWTDSGNVVKDLETGDNSFIRLLHPVPEQGAYDFRIRVYDKVDDANGPWAQIAARTNRPPEFTAANAARSIAENSGAGANVGRPVTAADPDGDTIAYSLSGADAASFSIVAATGQITANSSLDYETKSAYSLTVTADDGRGSDGLDTIEVAVNVLDVPEGVFPRITGPQSVVTGSFKIKVTYSEPVTGLEADDFVTDDIPEGAIYAISGSGAEYTFGVTPGRNGELKFRLPAGAALDERGDATAASPRPFTARVNVNRPLVKMFRHEPSPTVVGPFNLYISFSEDVTVHDRSNPRNKLTDSASTDLNLPYGKYMLDMERIRITNGQAVGLYRRHVGGPHAEETRRHYTLAVAPLGDGPVTVDLLDWAGYVIYAIDSDDDGYDPDLQYIRGSEPARFSVKADLYRTVPTISGPEGPVKGPFDVTVTFSKGARTVGANQRDTPVNRMLEIDNGEIVEVDDIIYVHKEVKKGILSATFTIEPTDSGPVTIDLPEGYVLAHGVSFYDSPLSPSWGPPSTTDYIGYREWSKGNFAADTFTVRANLD